MKTHGISATCMAVADSRKEAFWFTQITQILEDTQISQKKYFYWLVR
jgi:hypothetical protein